jgi:hypothetical protein
MLALVLVPFTPFTLEQGLPICGVSIERRFLDLKAKPAGSSYERAKDVGAFANHLGGVLLIGASEVDGRLSAYVGMSPNVAAQARHDYSQAVAQRCHPPPAIDFVEFSDPNDASKSIFAVNVPPSLSLVGVKVQSDKAGGYGGDSFVFPVRTGTDCVYLQPTQLAMYMTPAVRRVAVLLSKVPRGARIQIKVWVPTNMMAGRGQHVYTGVLDEVREEENLVLFNAKDDGRPMRRVPLDCITSVYEDWDPDARQLQWTMIVDYERG